jgi:FtsP/CotA-like multicopper oxidase with cupredoxin domain
MSRNQRIGLIVGALVVAVVAFVISSPGGDDESSDQAAQTTQATTQPESGGEGETTPAETEPAAPKPQVTRIQIQGGEVVGGAPSITVKSGDVVNIVVSADAPDDIHLHGYDIEKKVEPGQPARFKVKTNLEGSFEMESHVAEDAGMDPLVARLNVEPR